VESFKAEIASRVGKALGLAPDAIAPMLEAPKDPKRGDLALPCFKLAKPLGREGKDAALTIARDIVSKTEKGDAIAEITATGPFVNFRLAAGAVPASVLRAIAAPGRFGGSDEGKGKTIVLDYSSPNIAKPFHLGHLRSTVIGHAIRKLYESLGYTVHGVNHLGDWGTQFGFMLAAWQRWQGEAEARIAKGEGEIDVFVSLYVRINKLSKKDPKVRDEARSWFKRLEDGDPEARRLWRYFVDRSKTEFDRIYAILGIKHESDAGESFYNDKMQPVIDLLREKGLLVQGKQVEKPDEDALVDAAAGARPFGVELGDPEEGGLGFPLLLKSDGGTTYATRDLAAAFYRWNTYHPEKIVYVVGSPQILHFRQLKAILAKLGVPWEEKLVHVPFGQYLGMSTRAGNVVFLDAVLTRARAVAIEAGEAATKKQELTALEIADNARKIGAGALKFFDLKNARTMDIALTKPYVACPQHPAVELESGTDCATCGSKLERVHHCPEHPGNEALSEHAICKACGEKLIEKRTPLDLDRLLATNGETGPYVLFSYARLSGVLRRLGEEPTTNVDFSKLAEPEAVALVKALGEHPGRVRLALADHEPSIVARHLLDVAHAAHSFLHIHRVIDAEPEVRKARALLVACARKVVGQCLEILGIEPLEKM
jgi:arginyl-tRNA synthetase